MFDEVVEAQQAVMLAKNKVHRAHLAAVEDNDAGAVSRKLLALDYALRAAEFLAAEVYNEALAVKVARAHGLRAPTGGGHGA